MPKQNATRYAVLGLLNRKPSSGYDVKQAKSVAAGLIIPNKATCVTCHNEKSPTFKGFDYATYFAKIAHPNPKAAGSK